MTAADAPAGRRARRSRDQNLVRLLVMLVFVFVLMTILRPGQFATLADFNSMMRQFPEYGIMAIGMSLTMITGGIDLGVVGTANLSAIVAAMFLIGAVPAGALPAQVVPYLVAAVLFALATGLACGAIAGSSDLPVQYSRHPGHSRHATALHRDRNRRHERAGRRAGCRSFIRRSATPSSYISFPSPSSSSSRSRLPWDSCCPGRGLGLTFT